MEYYHPYKVKTSYLQTWKNVKCAVFMSVPDKEQQIPCDLKSLQNTKKS